MRRAIGVAASALVAVWVSLVHVGAAGAAESGGSSTPQRKPAAERRFEGALPPNVAEMRDAIRAGIESGDIDDLKAAIEWNELAPDFGPDAGADAIAWWRRLSADGRGLEVLAVLANLLALPPAKIAVGRDAENAAVFVWPYLAEMSPKEFTAAEEAEALRLMPPQIIKTMKEKNKWLWWRLAISADGTWLVFRKYD